MKNFTALTVLAALSLSLVSFSGCDDFKFNPIGQWKFTDDIVYEHGKEIGRDTKDKLVFDVVFNFEKSGTGYVTADGDKTMDFQYEYDDNSVTITTATMFTNDTPEEERKKNPTTTIKYQLSDDKTQMWHSVDQTFTSEEGDIVLTERMVYTRQ